MSQEQPVIPDLDQDSTRSWLSLVRRLGYGLALAVLVIALLVAVIFGIMRENKTASCVNQILGDRQGTTSGDSSAQRAFIDAVNEALNPPKGISQAQYAAILAHLQRVSSQAKETLDHDAQVREAHPLGRC